MKIKIFKNVLVVIVLFYLLFKSSGITSIMLIPFIVCGISLVLKDICILLNKDKFVNIFKKIFIISFLIFWFGILLFGTYLIIKEKEYATFLFTIPFWIVGIYIIKKFLLRKE